MNNKCNKKLRKDLKNLLYIIFYLYLMNNKLILIYRKNIIKFIN